MPCEQMLASVCLEGEESKTVFSCLLPPPPTPRHVTSVFIPGLPDSAGFWLRLSPPNFSLLVWVPVALTSPLLWSGSFLHSFQLLVALLWHKSGKLSAPHCPQIWQGMPPQVRDLEAAPAPMKGQTCLKATPIKVRTQNQADVAFVKVPET